MTNTCSITILKDQGIVLKHVEDRGQEEGERLSFVIQHRHVLQALGIFEGIAQSISISFPYAKGGNLYDFLENLNRPLSDDELKITLKCIHKGIQALHGNSICHRNINLKNILLMKNGLLESCVIANLEQACKINENSCISGDCGSPLFKAPEVEKGEYDMKADMWSMGIVDFVLVTGRYPHKNVLEDIQSLKVSPQLQDLLFGLLQKNPHARFSASDALDRPYFNKPVKRFDTFLQLSDNYTQDQISS